MLQRQHIGLLAEQTLLVLEVEVEETAAEPVEDIITQSILQFGPAAGQANILASGKRIVTTAQAVQQDGSSQSLSQARPVTQSLVD